MIRPLKFRLVQYIHTARASLQQPAGAETGNSEEADFQKLKKILLALHYLIDLIGDKDTTLCELCALLMKPNTEKANKVLKQEGTSPPPKTSAPFHADPREKSKPVNGRNGETVYRGAEWIKVPDGSLRPEDHCQKCQKRKVFPKKEPGSRLRVTGKALAAARAGDLKRLYGHLCGKVFAEVVPSRREGLAKLGFWALLAGTLANYLSAAIVGLFIH